MDTIAPDLVKWTDSSYFVQCILGSGDTKIKATLKMPGLVKILDRKRDDISNGAAKLVLSNYQKNKGELYTSAQTIGEIEFEVRLIDRYLKNTTKHFCLIVVQKGKNIYMYLND